MVDLINANADAFSYARVIRPPIVEGLEFWNYYGGDSDMRRNLVPGKPAGIPAGDPTVGDFYIQCEGMTHYVQTAVPASNEFTLIAVAKEVVPDGGSCPLISNTGSAAQESGASIPGASIYLNDAITANGLMRLTALQAANDGGTPVSVVASTQDYNIANTGPQMFTCRYRANGDRVAKIMGSALTATVNSDKPPMLAQSYRIGSQYNSNAKGLVRIHAAIIYSRALADAELDQLYAFVQAFYGRRGIVI